MDDKGYLDEATVIKATQSSEHQPYDVVRQALKEVDLDSSRRVELDDYVDVCEEKLSLCSQGIEASLKNRSSSPRSGQPILHRPHE